MLSGRKTLGTIDQTLSQLQQQIRESDAQINQFSDEKLQLGQQQAYEFQALARSRLDHVLSGEVQAKLDTANLRVQALLKKRQLALEELKNSISIAQEKQQTTEKNRSVLADERAKLMSALESQEQNVLQRLQKKEAYRAQLERVLLSEQTATQAEDKMRDAQQNRTKKGVPYEADSLFIYLWDRGYGTSSYHANSLIRFLDKWVADLCNYHGVRANYAMLLEIPIRLKEHAESLLSAAKQEADVLLEIENLAATEAGIPELHAALALVQQQIADADEQIAQMEAAMHVWQNDKIAFSGGEDAYFSQAVETLADVLQKENLDTLYQRARATPDAQDDMIVERLYAQDRQLERLQKNLSQLKSIHAQHLQRLAEMENVRHKFKQARYDEPGSEFDNKGLLLMILNEFLKGVANSDGVWDTIRREQRSRPVDKPPPFGYNRAGSSPWGNSFPGNGGNRRSPWGGGLGGSARRNQPRKPSGGFRTGGGF